MITHSNPILARFIRDSKFPNLPQTIALTAVLAAATIIAVSYVSPVRSAMFSLSTLISLFGPPLVGGLAALTAGQDSKSEAYTLLKLTPVPRSTIVWGYFWAALFRVRVVLAVLIGVFIPAFMATPTLLTQPPAGFDVCHVIVPPDQSRLAGQFGPPIGPCVAADDPRLLASRALSTFVYPGIILLVIPFAMLGVAVGLAGRSSVVAATAVVIVLGVIALLVGLTLLGPAIGEVFYCVLDCRVAHTWPPDPLPPLIYLGGLTLTTAGLASLAGRYI